ncbi:hypothetical protein D3C87_1415950 [compost metagenome]
MQTIAQLLGFQHHVELRRIVMKQIRLHRKISGLPFASNRVLLQSKHDIKQRVSTGFPWNVQQIHQPVKRNVLMGKGLKHLRPYFPYKLAEAFVSFRTIADCQRIDKHADQVLHVGMLPAVHRSTDDQIFLPCILGQYDVKCSQQYDVQSAVLLPSNVMKLPGYFRCQLKFDPLALERLTSFSGKVQWKVKHGNFSTELIQPILLLIPAIFRSCKCLLPQRKILVLHPYRIQASIIVNVQQFL